MNKADFERQDFSNISKTPNATASVSLSGYTVLCPSGGLSGGNPENLKGNNVTTDGTKFCPRKAKSIKQLTSACFFWRSKGLHLIPMVLTVKDYGSVRGEREQHAYFSRGVSRMLDNIKKRYAVKDYLAVYEFQKRGILHAHVILVSRIKYIPILKLQYAWESAVRQMSVASNSVRLGTYVKTKVGYKRKFTLEGDVSKSIGYLSKYLSKDESTYYCRIYNASQGLTSINKRYDVPLEKLSKAFTMEVEGYHVEVFKASYEALFNQISLHLALLEANESPP